MHKNTGFLSFVVFMLLLTVCGVLFSAETGSLKWCFETGGPGTRIMKMALGEDGVIYMTLLWDNNLYAINPDGTKKWSYELDDDIPSFPVIGEDGTIYVASTNGLYAINPDGTKKWYLETEDRPRAPVIGKDDILYLGDGVRIYAVNPDGNKRWVVDSTCEPKAIAEDGTIYTCFRKSIYALTQDGEKMWSFDVDSRAGSRVGSPIINRDGMIYFGTTDDYYLHVIDLKEGAVKRIIRIGDAPKLGDGFSLVIGKDRTLYIASGDGHLYAVTPDGNIKWQFNIGDVPTGPSIGDNGTIYIGSGAYGINVVLYALNPDGTVKWSYKFDEVSPIADPVIGKDGIIYIGVGNKLYAIQGDSGGLATDAPWPKFRCDQRNSGRYQESRPLSK